MKVDDGHGGDEEQRRPQPEAAAGNTHGTAGLNQLPASRRAVAASPSAAQHPVRHGPENLVLDIVPPYGTRCLGTSPSAHTD